MLTDKTSNFIEKTACKLIVDYQTATGKKYNPNNLDSILDVVHFLNGEVIYLNDLHSKYNTDELLLSNNKGFTIIVDKEYREKQLEDAELSIKKIILRMIWTYIEEYIIDNNNVNSNKILYPKQSNIHEDELITLIKTKKYNL